jgi:UDP-N-acetylglucosamine 2-epimerase
MQTAWLWPNVDAGSDAVSKGLRMYREKNRPENMHFFLNFTPEDYVRLIDNCQCLVGNSSSAIREGAFLGVPAVNIGSRQHNRECGENVVHCGYDAGQIEDGIRKQLAHGKYAPNHLFGDGNAGLRIADILADATFSIQKKLCYE